MPPPANQGSRAALVTWTVVSCILFVTASIFAIYFYVSANKIEVQDKTTRDKYADMVDDSALGGPEITALKSARTASENPAIPGMNASTKLFDVALKQRDFLATKIMAAAAGDPDKAANAAQAALSQATGALKASGGGATPTSLSDAITSLTNALTAKQTEVKSLNANLTSANEALKKKVDETTAQLASMNTTLDSVRAEQAKAVSDEATLGSTKDDQIKQLQTQTDAQVKESQEQQLKLQAQVADANRKVRDLQQQLEITRNRLSGLRVDPTKPVIEQPDGHIVRLPGSNVCFIDLGYGDQISAGLTFEVYDKAEGIPPVGDPTNDESLPRGVASIEVTHVGATSSECRITNLTPGQAMSEGDPIVNLVYDKNTKYKFLVFGNFDLARTNKPNSQDAEIVKRLITQWGGTVVKDVNVDTDFVILGAEPLLPDFTKDELNDPLNKAKYDQSAADAAAYDEIKGKAKDLRIPILNQNRFLYFVGYYDQARH